MAKYTKHADKTLAKLTQTYIALCCEYGLSNVNLKLLCEKAEIYRSTFYNYFRNLDELLLWLEDDFLRRSNEIQMRLGSSYQNGAFYNELLDLFYEKRLLLLVLLGPNGSPRFLNKYKRFLRATLCERFLLQQPLDMPCELAIEYSVNGMLGSFYYLIKYSVTYDVAFNEPGTPIREYIIKTSTDLTDQIFYQTMTLKNAASAAAGHTARTTQTGGLSL